MQESDVLSFLQTIPGDVKIICNDGVVTAWGQILYLRLPKFPACVNYRCASVRIFIDHMTRGVKLPDDVNVDDLLGAMDLAIEYECESLILRRDKILLHYGSGGINSACKIIEWCARRGFTQLARNIAKTVAQKVRAQINVVPVIVCEHGSECDRAICCYCPNGELWSEHFGGCPRRPIYDSSDLAREGCPYWREPFGDVIAWIKYPSAAALISRSL